MTDPIAEAMWRGNPWLLPLALLGGLCTSLNPCAYPMMGAVTGYVWKHGGTSRWRSVGVSAAFLTGLAAVYGLLGAAGSLLVPVGLSHRHLMWIVGGICVAAGALMADVIPFEFTGSSLLMRYWGRLQGLPGAFLMGVLLGLVATPCATPPLVAIMSLAASRGAIWLGALLMVTYAVGHGLPAVVIGLAAGSLCGLQRFAARGRALQIAGGWLIIAVGFYLLATT